MLFAVLVAWIALAPLPSVAVEPGQRLDDLVLEARARDISKGLRCLVCQNQSIDDSGAGLARDLRVLVGHHGAHVGHHGAFLQGLVGLEDNIHNNLQVLSLSKNWVEHI